MATNINKSAPYFDDFDKNKNFHQILFRPGFAVQARELTQIQSIVKNQIEQFGNHIFRQGSIVIPGNSRGELNAQYVKISNLHNSVAINTSMFEGATIKGQTSGVKGIVRKVAEATSSDPITFYVNYMAGGVIDDEVTGKLTFIPGEILTIDGTTISCTILPTESSVGVGSIAFINTGVYYVNGTFVHVDAQSTILSKYSSYPSCHVLLKIVEEVVTSDSDTTLLDPAFGSYNFAAPGADRLKIHLELTTLPIDSVISDNYIEIMRYRYGTLEEHARTPKYNELEKSLARRTYDESGNYVVNGLRGIISEHKRESSNGGLFENGDINKFAVTVLPGKAYIRGFEVDKLSSTIIPLNKARTIEHVGYKESSVKLDFGRYIYITNVNGNIGISSRAEFSLYSTSNRLTSATPIGTGRAIAIDYHAGVPSSNTAIYKLYVNSIEMIGNNELIDVGGLRIGNNGSIAHAIVVHKYDSVVNTGILTNGDVITTTSNRTATVQFWNQLTSDIYVYKHDATKQIPKIGELFISGTTNAVIRGVTSISTTGTNLSMFPLPVSVVKSIKTPNGSFDHRYIVQKQVSILTDSIGDGSVTISDGIFKSPETGTLFAFTYAGVVDISLFSVSAAGNQLVISAGPTSTVINIICAVEKVSVSPRIKTLTTGVSIFSSYDITQRLFTLDHADVYEIESIVDNTGIITSNFNFFNGQTDHFYNNSYIELKSSATAPVGTITVTYKYFYHSSGDFFTFDSYTNNIGYENFILKYKTSAGNILDMQNYIDFRPTWNGTSYNTSDMIISGERFFTPIQFYMGRIDVLTINKDGNVVVIPGIPSETPRIPSTPIDSLALEHYSIPPYTNSVLDIGYTRYQVSRYTMADITKIANRVQRLEEFSTLNASENELVSYDVIDASTGLSRFKTGFLVESFNDPLTIGDITTNQFKSTFDAGTLCPSMDTMQCPALIQNLSNNTIFIKNSVAMLPYVEKVFARQNVSSRVTNLNPFMVVKWDGVLTVTPSSDSWIETLDLPAIFTQSSETVTVTRWVPSPAPPPVFMSQTIFVPPPPPPPLIIPVPPPPAEPTRPDPLIELLVSSWREFQLQLEAERLASIPVPPVTFVPVPPPVSPPVEPPAPPIAVVQPTVSPEMLGGSRNGNLSGMGRESGISGGFAGNTTSGSGFGGFGSGGFGGFGGTGDA